MTATFFKSASLTLAGLAAGSAAIAFAPSAPAQPAAGQPAATARQCEALAGQTIGGATIEKAEYIAKGGATISPLVKAVNDVCRVSARATPVAGSEIHLRIWLPSNWNGKMLGVGGAGLNGGFAAEWFIAILPLNEGYAVFSTDAGHEFIEDNAKWALGQPEKIKDYGYRANHVGALATKAVLASHYGTPPRRSYFHGCSNGGRDALIQAQRYPQDWDGIIAGAPAYNWTSVFTDFGRVAQISEPHRSAGLLGPKMKLVYDAAIRTCDAADGLKDGLISNPTTCRFDPSVLACRSGASSDCLSKSEVGALRKLYADVRTGDGQSIMAGFPVGSELNWESWFTRSDKEVAGGMQEIFRYMVHEDPEWSWRNFNLDRDYSAMRKLAPVIDATDSDLRPFAAHGGKLLMYHGWEDTALPAGNSIRYFEAARTKLGAKASQARLFMIPGQAHCFGGSGPNVVDLIGALDKWVEGNTPPERLTSSKYESFIAALTGQPTKLLQTRPVCAWPKTPHFKGTGDVNSESSFACR